METNGDIVMPEITQVPLNKIKGNPWNPNEMNPDEFNSLVDSIQQDGFLQPVLIAPLAEPDEEGHEYMQADGEHRADALRVLLSPDADCPCIVRDFSEDQQKFQMVKMNKLRGRFNSKKFSALVGDLMERHSFDEVAEQLAFTDPDELTAMIDQTRELLPPDLTEEFDKARGEIKTVDDLSLVLNRLFTEYGDTLPYNFMVMDFGGKRHLWVRMPSGSFLTMKGKAQQCMRQGVTFDSVVCQLLL